MSSQAPVLRHRTAFKHELMAGYNSPATYNTCMIASIFLGLRKLKVHVSVGDLLQLLLQYVPIESLGECMSSCTKGSYEAVDKAATSIERNVNTFLQALTLKYGVAIHFWTCTTSLENTGKYPGIVFQKGTRAQTVGKYYRTISMFLHEGHFYYMFGHAESDRELMRKANSYKKDISDLNEWSREYNQVAKSLIDGLRPNLNNCSHMESDSKLAQELYVRELNNRVFLGKKNEQERDHQMAMQMHQELNEQPSNSVPVPVPVPASTHDLSFLPQVTYPTTQPLMEQEREYQSDTLNPSILRQQDALRQQRKLEEQVEQESRHKELPYPTHPTHPAYPTHPTYPSQPLHVYSNHTIVSYIQNNNFVQDLLSDQALLQRALDLSSQLYTQGQLHPYN